METLIIWIDPGDPSHADAHAETHPHVLRIYSEADECNHSFRVKETTHLAHVFDEFYARTKVQPSELDRMKCEANGENLLPLRETTIGHLRSSGECGELVWIFTNRPVRIYVDTQPKEVSAKQISYLKVVELAYDGAVPTGDSWSFQVVYSHGPRANRDGSLTKGKSVFIKDGMEFIVTPTNRS